MKRPSLHNHSTHTRDAALQRLRSINRWLIMGCIVLTGVFADVAANAFPGHKKKAAAAASRHKAKSAPTGVLAPPEQAPEASSGQSESDTPSEGSAGEGSGAEPSPSSEAQAPETSEAPETSSAPEASEESSSTESAPSEPSEPVVSGGS
jgi:hypothetical protein